MTRLAVGVTVALLSASPLFAQEPGAPVVPTPEIAPPALTPVQENLPFPEGAQYAFIDFQLVAQVSALGQAATNQVQALETQRVNELNQRNQTLQASQQKLQAGSGVMSLEAIAQLQQEISRQQIALQRASEDAQAEVQRLQEDLNADIQQRLSLVVQQVFEERGLLMLFESTASGLVLGDPALDLSAEVLQRFDQESAAPAAP